MLTLEEKIQTVENEILYIEALNKVLYDAIMHTEISNNGDYLSLLQVQYKYIEKITELF